MIIDELIIIVHITLLYSMLISILVKDIYLKKLVLLILLFLQMQFISKYGKCGIINIEKYFLKDKFREGIAFKTIRPVISYKMNILYTKYSYIHILYIIILAYQLLSKYKYI
jgi:hypothetical protein